MGRKFSFQGSSKALSAGVIQTVTFTPTDIESAGCVQLVFACTGAGNSLADFDRFRVRAGGDIIMDCNKDQLQAYQQRWSNSFKANLDAATVFSLPLNFLDAPRGMSGESQDQCQFPPNREIQVEIITLATVAAGTLIAGWKQTDVPAQYFMRYYSAVLNLPASARNVKYPFSEPGIVRGLTLPVAGIDRAELYISDRSAWRAPGPQFGAVTTGDMLTEKDFFEDGTAVAAANRHHSVDLGLPATAGSSYLIMDTGAGWAGVGAEGVFYAIVPLARG